MTFASRSWRLLFKTLNFSLKLIRPLLTGYRRLFHGKYLKQDLTQAPVFIIGPPRTGSTILYQVLTNQFDVLFINNLACRFYNRLSFGMWLSEKVFQGRPHNSFKSVHGNTIQDGLGAPSECGQFWYRWLSREKHFIDHHEITQKMVKQIREEIKLVTNYFNKPLIFKNLNAGQRLRLISRCFPEAKIIFITRDPLMTAQSIIRGKRRNHIPDDVFWGIMPPDVEELKKLKAYEQIVRQIHSIEEQIIQDLGLFPKDQILHLSYEEMCEDIDSIRNILASFISAGEREGYELPVLDCNESLTLGAEEIERFQDEIAKLEWNTNYH